MWKLCQQKSSKMKVSLQENCSLNQDKSSPLNRSDSQAFNDISGYSSRGVQYKSSTLPPPPPPSRTSKVSNQSTANYNKVGQVSVPSSTMSASDDSCAINELLEGRMYLTVFLPPELIIYKNSSSNQIVINVERRTPMMDILVNIATQYKFNASKYRINVEGFSFQASTPIGSLDVNTISIVPKPLKVGFRSNLAKSELNIPQSVPSSSSVIYQNPIKQRSATLSTPSITINPSENQPTNLNYHANHQGLSFVSNVPFKTTFRLQVNLPRNQLMVLRVSPESTIAQIKNKICDEKELDSSKYLLTVKNERNEMLILDSAKHLSDYGINEVTLMSTNLLTKVQMEPSALHHLTGANDDQLQDPKSLNEQLANQNGGKSNKIMKKRPAPLPPSRMSSDCGSKVGNGKKESAECRENSSANSIHLRQDSGSDSSGYHESLISSESHKSSSDAINQPKSQNKSMSDQENMKKGAIKKRKAPLPPNWRDTKSDFGESSGCLSDVSVPLSSSSASSRQSDYRIGGGRASSNRTSTPPGDESSFTLVSGSDDLSDIGTLKGSDSVPIPSPDSGTCSHVPLDEEKGSEGIASAPGSAIMSDSAIGDTIAEQAEIELEQESYKKRQSMKPLSYSSTSPVNLNGPKRSTISINKQVVEEPLEIDSAIPVNLKYSNDSGSSSNSTSSYGQPTPADCPITFSKESFTSFNQQDSSELISECEQFKKIHPNTDSKYVSIESNEANSNETQSEMLLAESTIDADNQLNHDDGVRLSRSVSIRTADEISSDEFEESKEKESSTSSSGDNISMEGEAETRNNDEDPEKVPDVNQRETELSIESTRPTVSGTKTIVNDGEANCDNENEQIHLEEKKSEENEERFDCLFGQDVKTRSPAADHDDSGCEERDSDRKMDMNHESEREDGVSSSFVRDMCRPRVRLTNFKIGSYKELDNLDIYESYNGASECKERPKSLNIDTIKPVIVTASFKNVNSSACNEFGHGKVKSDSSNCSSQNKISMITPQPFKLNRLASWSGTDTKSFRQAYANISNCIGDRETIAEKAEKIEKVLKMDKRMDKLYGLKVNENSSHGRTVKVALHEPQIVSTSSSNGHRCVSQIEINGDTSRVSIRNTVTSIKGINLDDESPIQVTTFVKSEQPVASDSSKLKLPEESNTKLEIINTVKPSSKSVLTRIDPISSRFNATPTTKGSKPKVPITTSSLVPQPPPPPPPPPPMPTISKIPSKIVNNLSAHRKSTDQTNLKEKPSSKIVPKLKTNPSVNGAPKADFHDALLNEIRACGGRRALRKVNINR